MKTIRISTFVSAILFSCCLTGGALASGKSTPPIKKNFYGCFDRLTPDNKFERLRVSARKNDDFSLTEHIQIFKEDNHLSMPGDPTHITLNDRIGLFKWDHINNKYLLARRTYFGLEKEQVVMEVVAESAGLNVYPGYLFGQDSEGTEYYLLFNGGEKTCSYPSVNKCEQYTYEVYTLESLKKYITPMSAVWNDCSGALQPSGGSGEVPPKDPG